MKYYKYLTYFSFPIIAENPPKTFRKFTSYQLRNHTIPGHIFDRSGKHFIPIYFIHFKCVLYAYLVQRIIRPGGSKKLHSLAQSNAILSNVSFSYVQNMRCFVCFDSRTSQAIHVYDAHCIYYIGQVHYIVHFIVYSGKCNKSSPCTNSHLVKVSELGIYMQSQ